MFMSMSPQQRQKLVQIIDDALAKSELRSDPQVKTLRTMMGRFSGDINAKNVDLNSLLRLLGIGLNLGGVNVGFSGPEVSVNSPLGRIGCGFLREPSPAAGHNWQKPETFTVGNTNGEDEVDDLKRLV